MTPSRGAESAAVLPEEIVPEPLHAAEAAAGADAARTIAGAARAASAHEASAPEEAPAEDASLRGAKAAAASTPDPSPRRPAPAPDRTRHLEVVRGRPVPGRRPPVRLFTVAGLATTLGLFLIIGINVLVGQAAVARADLEARVRERRLQVERLEVQVAGLRAPAALERRAQKLGLVPAPDVVILSPDARRAPAPESRGEGD